MTVQLYKQWCGQSAGRSKWYEHCTWCMCRVRRASSTVSNSIPGPHCAAPVCSDTHILLVSAQQPIHIPCVPQPTAQPALASNLEAPVPQVLSSNAEHLPAHHAGMSHSSLCWHQPAAVFSPLHTAPWQPAYKHLGCHCRAEEHGQWLEQST